MIRFAAAPRPRVAAYALVAAFLFGTVPGAAAAETADTFFKGRQILVVIGNNAGTAYDASARLVARHLGRHVAGAPTTLVQNMPGATGLTAANYVANVAPRDGSVIANAHQSLPLRQLLGDKAVRYDARGFQWIGSPEMSNQTIAVWHTAGVAGIDDAKTRDVVMGGTTRRADTSVVLALANNLIGTRFKVILGYKANQIDIAIEQGEVQGRVAIWSGLKATKPAWVRDAKVRVIGQLGLKREAELPDVPLLQELVSDPGDRRVIELFSAQLALGRPFYASEGVPAGRVDALRRGFDAMVASADFLEDARRSGHDISPVPAAALADIVRAMMATPADLLARAQKAQDLGRDTGRAAKP